MDRREILKRVKEKEFVKRCIAVGICSECGIDLVDIESSSSSWVSLACDNSKCPEAGKTRSSSRVEG